MDHYMISPQPGEGRIPIQEASGSTNSPLVNVGHLQDDLQATKESLDQQIQATKKMAMELDCLRSQNQGFYELNDDDVISMVNQLRSEILGLSLQYFDGPRDQHTSPPPADIPKWGQEMFRRTIINWENHERWSCDAYLNSSTRRHSIVQAFLWRVLERNILNQVRWVDDEKVGEATYELQSAIDPGKFTSDLEELRDFQIWKATTTKLLLRNQERGLHEGKHQHPLHFAESLARKTSEVLRELMVPNQDEQELQGRLLDIFVEAIEQDRDISRQPARVEYDFSPPEGNRFDDTQMRLEGKESMPPDGSTVIMVLAPSVSKRGRSTGEGFNTRRLLVPMEVTCSYPCDVLGSTRRTSRHHATDRTREIHLEEPGLF